jgi:hypothetical protein
MAWRPQSAVSLNAQAEEPMQTEIRNQLQQVRNGEFAGELDEIRRLGASLRETAADPGGLSAQDVIAAIDAEATPADADIASRALHVIAAGRCAESWGCSVPPS